ncbi:MAG: FHA domain-containing protein, partial [Lachnospiraceae bacterium]|nr:FHA domain-containing protein [Lachnospiraceae bacterium]
EDRMKEVEPDAMDPEDTSSYDSYGTYQNQQQYMEKMPSSYDQSDWPDSGSEELSFTAPEEEDTLRWKEDRTRRQGIDDFPDLKIGPEKEKEQKQEPEPALGPANSIPKTVILNREDMFWMHYPALISTEKDKRPDIMLKNRSNIIGKVREAVDVCIEGQGISRIHAKLAFSDGNCFLTDLGSTNGTYVNGSRIEQGERHQLEEGDEIRFADAGYVYKPA